LGIVIDPLVDSEIQETIDVPQATFFYKVKYEEIYIKLLFKLLH